MIGCLAVVNLVALAVAFWAGGLPGAGVLLLAEFGASAILGLVLMIGLSGREDPSKRRIRRRVDDLLSRAALEHHRLHDGCSDERPHGVVPLADGMTRVYCPNELGEPW